MGKNQSKEVSFVGFVQIELTPEQLNQFLEDDRNSKGIYLEVIANIKKGYRFTVSPLQETETYKAALFDINPRSKCQGYILTAEAPTVEEAIDLLMFKHLAIAGGDWLPFLQQPTQKRNYR